LLNVDPGADTNRTVVTFVGPPDAVEEAAFRGIRKAAELIDMSIHKGEHPRMGATDVCPFVPVSDVTMEECVNIARRLGDRVGNELDIPVYLYEHAATSESRRSLADIRKGEYEGLAEKLIDPEWRPDYGAPRFNVRSGATVIGARQFLIAYNVNLNTRDKRLANRIAFRIREAGTARKDAAGNTLHDEKGEVVRTPGTLKAVRAVGWYIEEYGCAQISMNLLDYTTTAVHHAFDEVCRQADALGVRVTGSELVGLIPREAILESGRYFLRKQSRTAAVPERELIHAAVRSLGLSELSPFRPEERVIEYVIAPKEKKLVALPVADFVDEVSMDSPAPGGGTVAALASGMGAALVAMVGALTAGKKGFEDRLPEMERLGMEAQALKDRLIGDCDEDTKAFNRVLEAGRGKPKNPVEQGNQARAVDEATKGATLVPLGVLERSMRVVELAAQMVERGNPSSLSDAGVGGLMAAAGAEGAYLNVLINLPGVADREWAAATLQRARECIAAVRERSAALGAAVAQRLESR
jgi:glutamate formiminotransferase/formiminotetrahydrofolate cyclodeaminase